MCPAKTNADPEFCFAHRTLTLDDAFAGRAFQWNVIFRFTTAPIVAGYLCAMISRAACNFDVAMEQYVDGVASRVASRTLSDVGIRATVVSALAAHPAYYTEPYSRRLTLIDAFDRALSRFARQLVQVHPTDVSMATHIKESGIFVME